MSESEEKSKISNLIEVEAQADHLDSISKAKPIPALTELIWNAFDADSSEVRVVFGLNGLGSVEEIVIRDNGHGLPFDQIQSAFGFLGGSWKKNAGKTLHEKRILHGKEGKGRFKAFALGRRVVWKTVYQQTELDMSTKSRVIGEI